MGTLHLVRHGQASFGAADYDQLSPLGAEQCRRLGTWMAQRGWTFDTVWIGRLRRHRQSLEALAEGYGALPTATVHAGLDEYDSHALLDAAIAPEALAAAAALPGAEGYRAHFRLLREALARWMAGEAQAQGMPSWPDFGAGVADALARVRQETPAQGRALLVSSGGPIATAVAQVLEAPPASVIELNLRIRNSAVTEFSFSTRRHQLQAFNGIAHLEAPHWPEGQTYA